MASTEATTAAQQINALTEEQQKETARLLSAMNPDLFPANDAAKVTVWKVLIIGAFILAGVAIVAAVVALLKNEDSAPFFVFATAVATGIIGLFVASPTQNS